MGAAETAKLLASLDLHDGLTPVVKTMSGSLDKMDTRLGKSSTRAYKAGQQIGTGIKNGVVIAAGALTGLAGLLLVSAHEGQIAQTQQIKFNTAIQNSGKVSQAYVKILNDQQTALSNLTGADDEAIEATQTMLVTQGLSGAQIAKITPLILAAATATGRDLTSITLAVGRAVQGSATSLGKLGIVVPKAAKAVKSAALASLELKEKQLAAAKATEIAAGTLTKADKKVYDHRKAVLDAAIANQKLADAQKTTTKTTSDFDTVFDTLNSRFKGVNEALSQQLDTKLKAFNERLQDVRENAGIKLLPVLTRLVDVVSAKVLPAFSQFIDAILPSVIGGLNKLGDILSDSRSTSNITKLLDNAKTAASVIGNAAQATLTVVQTAVSLFASLPPEIQALAVAGLTINKLTGGLVTNLAGGLISAVISSFRGLMNVNAAVVNVNGGVGTGGVNPAAIAGAGVGIGTGTALGLITASVAGTALATADYVNKHITPLQDAHLTHAEILAQQYYTGDQATQQQILKHTGTLPTQADFDAGNAKIRDSQQDAIEKLRGTIADGVDVSVTNTAQLAAAVTKSRAADVAADRKARGVANTGPSKTITPRLQFLAAGHSGAKDVSVANALASGFESGTGPAFKSTAALKEAIKAVSKDIKTLPPKFTSPLTTDLTRLKAELARRTADAADKTARAAKAAGQLAAGAIRDKSFNVTVPVTNNVVINGRTFEANLVRYRTTASGQVIVATGGGGA